MDRKKRALTDAGRWAAVMNIEVMMDEFENELLKCINDSFSEDIEQNIIEIATNRDEPQKIIAQETNSGGFEYKTIESSESLMVEVVRKTKKLKHIRVVVKSPDSTMMEKISDWQSIIGAMVEMAKSILNSPPFERHVNQGVIQLSGGEKVRIEFIPRDKL
ncbi:MAG: hypothetical protein C4548_11420 [Desulfobacteraceae bacterium]|nr:MAG: hypothetical protein C4548_11420 [Desulfobacteraceae bacterium]